MDIVDGQIYSVASRLLSCVVDALADSIGGAPKRAGVVAGDPSLVADEECCEGQVAVGVVNTFTSRVFPQPAIVADPCDASILGVQLWVRVSRCAPVGHGRQAPSIEALDEAAQQVFNDIERARYAIRCCFADDDDVDLLLGTQDVWGPQGACVGHISFVQVGLDAGCDCAGG